MPDTQVVDAIEPGTNATRRIHHAAQLAVSERAGR